MIVEDDAALSNGIVLALKDDNCTFVQAGCHGDGVIDNIQLPIINIPVRRILEKKRPNFS